MNLIIQSKMFRKDIQLQHQKDLLFLEIRLQQLLKVMIRKSYLLPLFLELQIIPWSIISRIVQIKQSIP